MRQEQSEIAQEIARELQKARTLVDLVGHIDLINPPGKGTLVEAMSLAREAIDLARELLDWCEVRELGSPEDEYDTDEAVESLQGEHSTRA
jgi:thioesterase domain-containing protein